MKNSIAETNTKNDRQSNQIQYFYQNPQTQTNHQYEEAFVRFESYMISTAYIHPNFLSHHQVILVESSSNYKVVDLIKSPSNFKDPQQIPMVPKTLHLNIELLDFHDVFSLDQCQSEEKEDRHNGINRGEIKTLQLYILPEKQKYLIFRPIILFVYDRGKQSMVLQYAWWNPISFYIFLLIKHLYNNETIRIFFFIYNLEFYFTSLFSTFIRLYFHFLFFSLFAFRFLKSLVFLIFQDQFIYMKSWCSQMLLIN